MTKQALLIPSIIFLLCIACHSATRDYTHAIIHHTASPDWPVERLRKIHVEERGWDDVGYHFCIRADGTVEKGRDLHKQGAHAKGRNQFTGIVLTGYDTFTNQQIKALKDLLRNLGVRSIEEHHEKCAGRGLNLKEIANDVGINYVGRGW
ncbi:MAG: N-acetylmuramoyl-L-alanine amidase [Candidatus Omnitrophica bacterium]|nr:N-acetylmuramoyl-L-alanine amidase [Candidatus Omnitrophota bacterium]